MTESWIIIPIHVEDFLVELEESAKTGILVAYDYSLIGVLGVADPRKREAAVIVEDLKKMNVMPVMVTGNNWRTSRAVTREVYITFMCYSVEAQILAYETRNSLSSDI